MWTKDGNRELKYVDHFKYFGNVLTREIKRKIDITKETFNRKISLLKSKLYILFRKKLTRSLVWSIALYYSETWALSKFEQKYLESFEMWCWRRTKKIKWSEKVF